MNVIVALGKIFDPANRYEKFLPEGRDSDGVSRQHFQGARKRVEMLIEEYKKLQENTKKSWEKLQEATHFDSNLRFTSELTEAFAFYENNLKAERKMEAKLNRWLGYFQGLIVTNSGASLDEMKQINKNS